MTAFRYAQYCPVARAAEVVGNRWSLLVLRELTLGPQRFSDLRRRLAGVSASVLAERLAALERFEVIETAELPPPAASRVYRLTAHGEAFRPVLAALLRWGLRWMGAPSEGDHFEPDWLRFVLQTFAAPGPTPARRYELHVEADGPNERIRFEGGEEGLRLVDDTRPADLVLEGGPADLLGLLSGLLSADAARARGARLVGDLAALADLPRQFDFGSRARSTANPGATS